MRSADGRAGFTLVESLAALAVVGLVLASALGAAVADARSSGRAAHTVEASALLEDLLARAPYARWDAALDYGRATQGRYPPPLDGYAWTLEVHPAAEEPGLVEAAATVRWSGGELRGATRFLPLPDAPAEEAR